MRYPRPVARLARAASLSFCLLSAAAAIVSHGAPRPILGSDAQPSIEHPRARAEAGALPAQQHRSTKVEIVAVYPEGQMPDQGDEGLRIENTGDLPASMAGWTLDDGEGRAAFPEGTTLDPGRGWWIAAEPKAFESVFGHAPDWAWRPSSAGAARNLVTIGAGPRLADRGDEIVLRNAEGTAVDALVYRSGSLKGSRDEGAWKGPGLEPYHPGSIRGSHQVFLRKRDPSTGRWIGNGDSSAGWRSDPLDARLGRRAVYPGWDLEHRPRPLRHLTDAEVEVAVAPDALLPFLLRHFRDARSSIDLQVYTFESPWVAEALAERARDGVRVRVLVEGSPAGGLDLNERFALHQIHRAGGSVYFMDRGGDVAPRYRGMHAKLGLIDERRVLIGSENPNPGAAPADDPLDGTAGRRGVFLAIQAAPAANWARSIIRDDLDPNHHRDIRPFQPRDPERGAPPEDFRPEWGGSDSGYLPIAPRPLILREVVELELLSAPENVLDPEHGLPGLVKRAGPGDQLRVQQLSEPLYWGEGPGEGPIALNPRVVAYLEAARRGALVQILLDGYFDEPTSPRSNTATASFLNQTARAEGLNLETRLGNPAGKGLHNKMILVEAQERWAHVGSINGSEVANKVNREAGVSIRSAAVHDYLARVFDWDWARSGANAVYMPSLDVR